MAQPTTVATLLLRNKDYSAHHHDPPPTFADMQASKVPPPRIAIVSCLDPRASPEHFLQLEPGSREVAILRNLGGRGAECVNDIVALDTLVGLEEVMVVHHTDCGAASYTNEMVHAKIEGRLAQYEAAKESDPGAIQTLEKRLGDDVKALKNAPYMRPELAMKTFGCVYDIITGELRRADG